MSFFEDIAAALDTEGIESRVHDDTMFVPITSDLEIQFQEIDPHMPAANVYISASDVDEDEVMAVERDDGSWLLAGYLPIDEMAETLGIPLPEKRDYETLAGFVLSHMHHLPQVGEHVDVMGWRFEVMDLDGRRIDKVLASRSIKTHREART